MGLGRCLSGRGSWRGPCGWWGLLSLDYLSMAGYLLAVTGSGVLLHLVTGGPLRSRGVVDRRLLLVMAAPTCWWSR